MISDYSEGGLRMIDLISFNKALKSTGGRGWVKKYLDPENHGKWKFFLLATTTLWQPSRFQRKPE